MYIGSTKQQDSQQSRVKLGSTQLCRAKGDLCQSDQQSLEHSIQFVCAHIHSHSFIATLESFHIPVPRSGNRHWVPIGRASIHASKEKGGEKQTHKQAAYLKTSILILYFPDTGFRMIQTLFSFQPQCSCSVPRVKEAGGASPCVSSKATLNFSCTVNTATYSSFCAQITALKTTRRVLNCGWVGVVEGKSTTKSSKTGSAYDTQPGKQHLKSKDKKIPPST